MIRTIIYGVLLWATTIYALRKGGLEERIAALGLFISSYLTWIVIRPFATRYSNLEIPVVSVDATLAVILLWLALRSDKFWPLWLVAMQTLATLAHFAPWVPHIIPWGYGSAVAIWGYPMLIVLFVIIRMASHDQHLG